MSLKLTSDGDMAGPRNSDSRLLRLGSEEGGGGGGGSRYSDIRSLEVAGPRLEDMSSL